MLCIGHILFFCLTTSYGVYPAFFDRPFVEYLNSRKLSPMIRSFLLYCIALAEFNQEASARRLSTRDAVGRVTQFIKSIGRYGNGLV